MPREKFSERELTEIVGIYPTVTFPGLPSLPDEPKFYRPVSPLENFKLLAEGKTPYWIPRAGWLMCDVQPFRPRLHPDNVVTHIIMDGEPPYEYESDVMTSGMFDLEWEYVPSAMGATVHPGNPKVADITRWEEYVSIPDLDSLDWAGCEKNNKAFLSSDKVKQLGILSGFWERLMSLCDVEAAAVALVDEDMKDGVHRLFDKLADMHIEYITRMNQVCDIDCVLIHDDWGHQRAPFFSLNTAREMLVPYLRRVTDHCHKLGLFFELHSCGKNEMLVPAYIEAGVDLWCGQAINDVDMLIEKHKDSRLIFGVPDPVIPPEASEAELRALAMAWVDKYKNKRAVQAFFAAPPAFGMAVYEFSRKAYENA